MFDNLFDSETGIYTVTLFVGLIFGVLELIAVLTGISFSFQSADTDTPTTNLSEWSNSAFFDRFLHSISLGKIPFIAGLILWGVFFGLIGHSLHAVIETILGKTFFWKWSAFPVFVVTFFILKPVEEMLAKYVFKEHTTVISSKELVGLKAQIITGDASKAVPAQAKTTDRFGQVHYIMVTPAEDEILKSGTTVEIQNVEVKADRTHFFVSKLKPD